MSKKNNCPKIPDEWNKPIKYTFSINCSTEFIEQLKTFTQRPALVCEDPEVLKGIIEILWRHEFKPFINGMVRQSTGCSFSWETLCKYKTVVDFQLEWPYS
jgi:hypothetical protein